MVNFTKFLDNVIRESISFGKADKPGIFWKFKYSDNTIFQFETKIKLSGKKHLYLILTKRKLSRDINIYLETYLSVRPNKNDDNYDFSTTETPGIDGYRYKTIRSMYLNSYPNLLKLYGMVKFNNYLTHTRTNELFVKDLIEWTKNDLLPWERFGDYSFRCKDTKYQDKEIFIRAGKTRLFIFLNGGQYKHFTLNNIELDSYGGNLLYDTIAKTEK